MKRFFGFFLYNFLFKHFACNQNRVFGKVSSFLRRKSLLLLCDYVGKGVNVDKNVTLSKKLQIGNYSGIGKNSMIQGQVIIGENVMIGPDLYVFTTNHNHERIDVPMRIQGFEKEKPVIISDDVWIGARVTILPGVVVGKGCIIGAGAVVTKNVSEYTVVGGNPAKELKKRY